MHCKRKYVNHRGIDFTSCKSNPYHEYILGCTDMFLCLISGVEKKTRLLAPTERRVVAYHESGHALVGWLLKYTDALLRVGNHSFHCYLFQINTSC